MTIKFQLAQLNIADARGTQTSEVMRGFVNRLEEIHLLADTAPGFIWRYRDEEGDVATSIFGNPATLINMSVWEDIESLRHFVYKTTHKELIQDRNHWFKKMTNQYQVMWWVKSNHKPSVAEAKEKLDLLSQLGSTQEAFTFGKPFTMPGN